MFLIDKGGVMSHQEILDDVWNGPDYTQLLDSLSRLARANSPSRRQEPRILDS